MENTNTVIVSKNNVNPIQQIAVNVVNVDVEPNENETIIVNYDNLTQEQKNLFNSCVQMIETFIP